MRPEVAASFQQACQALAQHLGELVEADDDKLSEQGHDRTYNSFGRCLIFIERCFHEGGELAAHELVRAGWRQRGLGFRQREVGMRRRAAAARAAA